MKMQICDFRFTQGAKWAADCVAVGRGGGCGGGIQIVFQIV
jgi:hypothetical protein